MRHFQLDDRLAADTVPVATLGLCELRLMNDSRWPWAILVPMRPGAIEVHDMTPLDQTMLTLETVLVARSLKSIVQADKINIGTLGNVVSMLHIHVVARFAGDPNWPGPVWGHGARSTYGEDAVRDRAETLRKAVLSA